METTRNHPDQNVLVTRMQVKTLYKQQTSHIKQYSNQSGLMEYNSGIRLPLITEILEHFQSKALRMIVDAPWYVPNMVIQRDL
jgi:hypothetical protein